jgi:hypothetical protein
MRHLKKRNGVAIIALAYPPMKMTSSGVNIQFDHTTGMMHDSHQTYYFLYQNKFVGQKKNPGMISISTIQYAFPAMELNMRIKHLPTPQLLKLTFSEKVYGS